MIATTILARVDNERLQRGVEGLASGAYSITVTRFTEDEISASGERRWQKLPGYLNGSPLVLRL
jgi:hypothetical protein